MPSFCPASKSVTRHATVSFYADKEDDMKVAVLGSQRWHAIAYEWSKAGYDV